MSKNNPFFKYPVEFTGEEREFLLDFLSEYVSTIAERKSVRELLLLSVDIEMFMNILMKLGYSEKEKRFDFERLFENFINEFDNTYKNQSKKEDIIKYLDQIYYYSDKDNERISFIYIIPEDKNNFYIIFWINNNFYLLTYNNNKEKDKFKDKVSYHMSNDKKGMIEYINKMLNDNIKAYYIQYHYKLKERIKRETIWDLEKQIKEI